MASFKTILTSIWHGIEKVVPIAGTVAEIAGSAFGPAVSTLIDTAVNGAEQFIQTEQAGAAKKASVTQIIESELPVIAQALAGIAPGKAATILNDPTVQQSISAAIDATVAGKNAIQAAVTAILAAAKA